MPVPVEVQVPYPVEVIKTEYIEVPVEVKVPEYITQTVIEKVVEPAPPVPVIVKTKNHKKTLKLRLKERWLRRLSLKSK